jgi:hypothetical protein
MFRPCYTIERLGGEWVISASDAKILICKNKSIALKVARGATALLFNQAGPDVPREGIVRPVANHAA